MKKTFTFLLLIITFCSYAQQVKYSKAKIYLNKNDKTLQNLAKMGLAVDHGESKKDTYFISDFSEREINKAKENGYTVDILIDDVSAYYANQNKDGSAEKKSEGTRSIGCNSSSSTGFVTPSHFHLGSMGGYFTYTEMLNILDSMTAQFPNLITAKQPIDTFHSIEGRPIYWLKISDHPNVNEPEPQIIYTALHHAREPASLSQMIYYMYYLLENYSTNPEIKALVDNTELYFVPCVNPDGYIYNQISNPSGGGMWRKNRRNNGDGTFGIDLNRNYGFDWGYDNIGSSPVTSDETYRGTAEFSEPEIQAVKWFDTHHQFKISINYHTFGNDLIYPWGYILDLYTPDSAVYVNHTRLMTSVNHFTSGTGNQTVGYVTNGDSDDWGYGDQTSKPKILSMTPEVGENDDGFWPPASHIITICQNSLSQNIYGAELIGKYALAKDVSPSVLNAKNGYLNYSVQRLGLDSPAVYTVSIIALDSWLTSVGSSKTYAALNLLQIQNDSISYTLNSSISPGQTFRYVIRVNNGYYDRNDTITKVYGMPITTYANNCSSISGFTSSGGTWGISTSQYVSPPSSITDSPSGNYHDNSNTKIELNAPIDLTSANAASLNFWAKWDIEAGYDYAEVAASNDGGSTWIPLCGKYTKPGNANQDTDKPIYDGTQSSWVWEEMSLNDYIGQTLRIRYQLVSDPGVNYDGFYFDDLSVSIVSSTTGINEISNDQNTVSQNIPNPASGLTYINFSLSEKKNLQLSVYNSLGQLIRQEKITDNQNTVSIDISGLSNGTYFYRIANQNYHSKMMKLVVLK